MQVIEARKLARSLFDVAVAAADPAQALRDHCCGFARPEPGGKTIVIAIGKAAPAMLGEALNHIRGPVTALAVTHHENTALVPGATVLHAGHPVPDQAGADAARQVIALLQSAKESDRVIALISGGGSALVPAPAGDITLHDKIALNEALLASGLDIVAMNLIRQQVSALKGGGLVRFATPAPVSAYILSDVIGDDLRAIASGPTTDPIGTPQQAAEMLQEAGLWADLPPAIRQHLTDADDPGPLPPVSNTLIGSNRQSLAAMLRAVPADLRSGIADDHLTGDVADAAARIVSAARSRSADVLIFGGETTVTLRGTGRGGRNQELALRIAMSGDLPGEWVFLSGGTDGRDGPTDAAGGLVDHTSARRIPDAAALLANNDSYAALDAADALLMTDATGTNVADVQVFIRIS